MKPNFKFIALTVLGATLAVTSCKKDKTTEPVEEVPTSTAGPSQSSINSFFAQNGAQSQYFNINAGVSSIVTGVKGTKLKIGANAFVNSSNQTVTGTVRIELREIYSKADMVLSGAPTTTDGRLLISGGEMFIRATQNGQILRLANNSNFNVLAPINGTPRPMREYYATTLADSLDWNPADSSGISPTDSVIVTNDSIVTCPTCTVNPSYSVTPVYEMDIDSLNWVNFDYLYGYSFGTETNITFNVGSQFNYGNCAVFVSVNGTNSVSRAWDYSSSSNIFTGHYLPAGQQAIIIAIANINGQYYSTFVPTTLAANGNYNLTLTATTLAQIQSQLTTLP